MPVIGLGCLPADTAALLSPFRGLVPPLPHDLVASAASNVFTAVRNTSTTWHIMVGELMAWAIRPWSQCYQMSDEFP